MAKFAFTLTLFMYRISSNSLHFFHILVDGVAVIAIVAAIVEFGVVVVVFVVSTFFPCESV